jgi:hypothetical protein
MDLGPYADRYTVSLDPSCRCSDVSDHWRCQEIKGIDGEIWPYSETHLVVAFFHSWRSRRDPQGEVIWIPSTRSPKAKRFQALAGRDAEVVQDCDEATCFKVPNRYLGRALRMIVPEPAGEAPVPADEKVSSGPHVCPSCLETHQPLESDDYCSVVCRVLGRSGLGWRINPYRIVDLKTGLVLSEGPSFDLTPRGIASLQERAKTLQAPSSQAHFPHAEAA